MITKHINIKQLDVSSKKVSSNTDFILMESPYLIKLPTKVIEVSAIPQLIEYMVQGLVYFDSETMPTLTINNTNQMVAVDWQDSPNNFSLSVNSISELVLQHEQIIDWIKQFKDQQRLYHQTGAPISVGIVLPSLEVYSIECVTQRSCYAKLMGALIKKHHNYAPILLCSHRIIAEDVDQLLAFKPSVILCQSAISASALSILEEHKITAFGFCRKRKYNRYLNFHI